MYSARSFSSIKFLLLRNWRLSISAQRLEFLSFSFLSSSVRSQIALLLLMRSSQSLSCSSDSSAFSYLLFVSARSFLRSLMNNFNKQYTQSYQAQAIDYSTHWIEVLIVQIREALLLLQCHRWFGQNIILVFSWTLNQVADLPVPSRGDINCAIQKSTCCLDGFTAEISVISNGFLVIAGQRAQFFDGVIELHLVTMSHHNASDIEAIFVLTVRFWGFSNPVDTISCLFAIPRQYYCSQIVLRLPKSILLLSNRLQQLCLLHSQFVSSNLQFSLMCFAQMYSLKILFCLNAFVDAVFFLDYSLSHRPIEELTLIATLLLASVGRKLFKEQHIFSIAEFERRPILIQPAWITLFQSLFQSTYFFPLLLPQTCKASFLL